MYFNTVALLPLSARGLLLTLVGGVVQHIIKRARNPLSHLFFFLLSDIL